jgi:small multidrug resistance pump
MIGADLAYLFLFIAIAAEVIGTSLLKVSAGFSRFWPTLGCFAGYTVAFLLLAQIVKQLPVGVVYAVWAGLGTASIVVVAAVFLGEPITTVKACGIALVIAGVVVLNLSGLH